MSINVTKITPAIRQYIFNLYPIKNKTLTLLTNYNKTLPLNSWPINQELGQLISILVKVTQAKKTLEIGVFSGYSTLITALALPTDGKIIACDIDKKMYTVADFFWKKAGVREKVDFKLAPAKDTLLELIKNGNKSTFDFVFIDANKEQYNLYYECALHLVKKNGLILIDNTLWGGTVINKNSNDTTTIHIKKLNKKIAQDSRVESTLLMIADGVTLVRKK